MKTAYALAAALLAGCATPVPVEHIVIDSGHNKARAEVKILRAEELRTSPHRIIEPNLIARSCQRLNTDPVANVEDGTAQLQVKAARMEANAIGSVRCEAEKYVALTANCWSSMLCRAAAVRLD